MYSHSYFIFNSSFATRQLNCCRRKVICQFQRLLLLYRRVTEKKKHKEILKSRMELYVLTNDNGGAADNALYSEGTGGESAFLNLNRLTRGKQATEWLLDTSVCLWPHHPEGGQSHPVFPLLSTIVRLILSEVSFIWSWLNRSQSLPVSLNSSLMVWSLIQGPCRYLVRVALSECCFAGVVIFLWGCLDGREDLNLRQSWDDSFFIHKQVLFLC